MNADSNWNFVTILVFFSFSNFILHTHKHLKASKFSLEFSDIEQANGKGKKIKDGRSWICYTDLEVFSIRFPCCVFFFSTNEKFARIHFVTNQLTIFPFLSFNLIKMESINFSHNIFFFK